MTIAQTRPGPAPQAGPGRAAQLLLRLSVLAVLIAVWQWVGDDSIRLNLPTFTRTVSALVSMAADGSLWRGLVLSNQAMVAGYLLALAVSLPLGISMGTSRRVERVVNPYLIMLLPVPLIAVLPLIQTIFGIGLGSRIVAVFLFAFIYMTVNTMVGVAGVDPQLREMGQSFGASRTKMLSQIVLPSAFPTMLAGARLGLARAIVGMVIAELFLASDGIGSMIRYYGARLDTGYVVALAVALVIEGVLLVAAARKIERRFFPPQEAA